LVIQMAAAFLLLLGIALIFRALLAIDLAERGREVPRPRLVRRLRREALRRANDADESRRAA
jgi:hypothetical protein